MKLIIAGSRSITDYAAVKFAVEKALLIWFGRIDPGKVEEVISGTARGVDKLGEKWADENEIPIIRFPAKWTDLGKAAGAIRNGVMAKHAGSSGGCVLVWDGKSSGTWNMYQQARKVGMRVLLEEVNAICRKS